MILPWSIHEAEVAIYPAGKDGWPLTGPAPDRGFPPLLAFKSSIRIRRMTKPGSRPALDFIGRQIPGDGGWSIEIDTPEGIREDKLTLTPNRIEPCAFYCLVIRFECHKNTGRWWRLRFYYVTLDDDSTSAPDQILQRGLSCMAGYLQEQVGLGTLPTMSPTPFGELIWHCGPLRVVAMTYDPDTRAWATTDQNSISDDEEAPPFAAIGESDGLQFVSYFIPRGTGTPDQQGDPAEAGTRMNIQWGHELAFTLGPDDSINPGPGFLLQHNGTPEPLLLSSQSRVFPEPMLHFRYLNRVYAGIGHGIIAIPALSSDPPPATHEPDFRIGRLRLLPFGGFFPSA